MTDAAKPDRQPGDDGGGRRLSPAAERALSEARARREAEAKASKDAAKEAPREVNGRGGLDPARYGDWEVKGIVSDF